MHLYTVLNCSECILSQLDFGSNITAILCVSASARDTIDRRHTTQYIRLNGMCFAYSDKEKRRAGQREVEGEEEKT